MRQHWSLFLFGLLFIELLSVENASAACGERGGPGYRGPDGRCVGWADIGKTCGSPPTEKCTPEIVADGADNAAKYGLKALNASSKAREQNKDVEK
jgi:hypothetical protein